MKENNYKENWLDFEHFQNKFQKVPVVEFPNNVLTFIPKPEVSVRITTYQHFDFIRDAIESVLVQKTNFPFEIIIGDDDSTDGTKEICIEYAKKYPNLIRLFLHKRENNISVLGKACGIFQITYNLFQSRGSFIAGCSGDDYWTDPYKLQKQYDFISQRPGFSYCYHDWIFKYEKTSDCESSFSKVFHRERAQTLLYKNIFHRIPEEFLNVIQEDIFIMFILNTVGKKQYIGGISPSVARIHGNNIWGVFRNNKQYLAQSINRIHTFENIRKVYNNTRHEKEIVNRLSMIFVSDTLKNPELNLVNKISILVRKPYFYRAIVIVASNFFRKLFNFKLLN